jgi:hypothetical protein
MTTLTRIVCTFGGAAMLAASAAAQDGGPRRPESPMGIQRGDGAPQRKAGPLIPPLRGVGPLPAPWVHESFQRNVELGASAMVEISGAYGDIRVTGGDAGTVRIAAAKRVREPNRDAARALLQNVNVRITERGGGVEVFTELPEGKNPPILVDYDITVPMAASVTVRSLGGTMRVANIKGEVRAEAVAGHILLTSVARVRHAKAFTGNLVISGAEGDEVNADTLGGTMQLRNVRARTVELRTVSGVMELNDIDCERCTIASVSGSIDFASTLRRNARYSITTNSGGIRFVPDGTIGFDLEARTGGALRSDYQLKQSSSPSPQVKGSVLQGTYGDGSAILSLRSFTGSITIVKPAVASR